MKLYFTLIITAVAMAFVSGYYALFMQGSYSYTHSDIVKIEKIKKSFISQVRPIIIIDIGSVYYDRVHNKSKLINPINAFVDDQYLLPSKDIFNSHNCTNIHLWARPPLSAKEAMWEEFRCGYRKKLPGHFFQIPPFIHKSQRSYAYLAFLSKRKPYNQKSWIKRHLSFFHALELASIQKIIGKLPTSLEVISRLDNQGLRLLNSGADFIMTDRFLLAKSSGYISGNIFDFRQESNYEYAVFNVRDLKRFIRHSPYEIFSYQKGDTCFYKDGQVCWEYNLRHLFRIANKGSIVFFFISLLIIILVVWILLSRIRIQKKEEERKRWALQVLTHEFRTPISSLLLQVELIKKKFDSLDEETQDIILRLSDDVYRLQRLTERSRNYLNVRQSKKLVILKKEKIESVNQFVSQLLSASSDKLEFIHLEKDLSLNMDPYWLGICIKNIVENAFAHGEPPYQLHLKVKGNKLNIIVTDGGKCEFSDLTEITTEFIKGKKSKGTGLGLSIVKKLVDDMGAKLHFSSSPTTFNLIFDLNK